MNPKAKRNPRRRNDKKFDKAEGKEFTEKVKDQKYNDPEWYIPNGQLAKDVASLSFNTPLGNSQWMHGSTPGSGKAAITLPGIMSIYTAPAVSPSKDGTSVINVAAKNLYSYVRHQNSGHSNYDSPDLMLYILAMDSVYAMISYMQSLYGTAMVFSQTNRYLGDALLTAKGARPSDIRNNLANFRTFINQYIVKASAFCVPRSLTLFKRHFWMFSSTFKDEETTKSQLYTYVPAYLYQYNLDNDNVGMLDPIDLCCGWNGVQYESKTNSLAEIESVADALLNQLMYSEDINIMSGDILKAYGREGLWTMNLIPEGYGVFPIYSSEILDQIHNTVFVGHKPSKGTPTQHEDSEESLRITQNRNIGEGELIYTPSFCYGFHTTWENILDIHSESPTPEEVLVSSRNMITGSMSATATDGFFTIESCGSDICLFANVYEYSNGILGAIKFYFSHSGNVEGANHLQTLASLSKFNKFPRFYVLPTNATPTTAPSAVWGEIDNYTVVDSKDIAKLHDTAMLSMLGVPTLGLVG